MTALESFLINNDFLSEKVPQGARGVSILISCDHVFLLNSLAWRGKKPFLGVVDLGAGAAGNAATCTLNNDTVLRHVCNFRLRGDRKCSAKHPCTGNH
jgi:hypothetical protein